MEENRIDVNITTEVGELKTVVMCLANPVSIKSFASELFDLAAVYQMYYNKVKLSYNHQKVRQQQLVLIDILKSNGVNVLLADQVPTSFAQHYTRDMGFGVDDTFFIANPRRKSRQREQEGLRHIFSDLSKVATLENGTIEGGDVLITKDKLIVGLGEETDREGVDCLQRKLEELGIEREVTPIEFAHRGAVHLDTKFNIIGEELAIIHPKSFTAESVKWLGDNFEFIEATKEEMNNLEINTFAISPKKLVMQHKSSRLASLVEEKGISVIPVDYSEVTRLPGSFRCTTLPIERL